MKHRFRIAITNAYGSDTEFQAWLSGLGLHLPGDAPTLAILRTLGSSYVDAAYEHRLKCSRRTGGNDQPLAWPRTGHNGLLPDLIPNPWVIASYRAAYLNGVSPGWSTGTTDIGRITKREKVDVIEREFFAAGEAGSSNAVDGMPSDGMIEGLVAPWLCSDGRRAGNLFRVI